MLQIADMYTYNPISTLESNKLWLKLKLIYHICQAIHRSYNKYEL